MFEINFIPEINKVRLERSVNKNVRTTTLMLIREMSPFFGEYFFKKFIIKKLIKLIKTLNYIQN